MAGVHFKAYLRIIFGYPSQKVPKEAKYADLNARFNEFMDAARAVGIVGEAVSQVTQERKRQRVSTEQLRTGGDMPDITVSNTMKSVEDISSVPLITTRADGYQLPRSVDQPSFPLLPDFLGALSGSGTPGIANTAAISSFDPNPLGVDGSSTEPMNDDLHEWLEFPGSTVLPDEK
jgi:hypothetical protein